MRQILPVIAFVGIVAMGIPFCRADEKSRAAIDRALQAAGGAENLARLSAQTWSEKGTYYGMGDGLPYTGKYAVQWPDKARLEIEGIFMIVVNGQKAWVRTDGETMALTGEQLEQQLNEHYVGFVSTLVPLKDPAFQLEYLGDQAVDGKPAVGVKVTREGKPRVDLFFDKATGLLVKSANLANSQEQGGKEVQQETFFLEYRAVDGIQIPGKILIKRDGEKFVEAENLETKLHEKLDDSLFAEPT